MAHSLTGLAAETQDGNFVEPPLPDGAPASHPKVQELRSLADWCEGMVWCSPERHGAMTGIMKSQIDWIPLAIGAIRPTQGKTLAVMEVSGGSQSFNAVNTLRLLGRWMRMFTIPNQSSVAMAYKEFDEAGRMKPSSYYDRIVDVMGSDSMGLSSAMDQFFNTARMLSTEPASTALRGSFMADASSVSSRFGEISGQLDLVQNETTQAVNGYVDQINTITSALAKVNNQLTKQKSLAAQPADLLDQRDNLLKNLSDFAHF